MSDIPIGTPPSPPGRHAAPGGWYPDPIDAAQERYWDGWQWSRTTRPREVGGLAYGAGQQPYGPAPYQGSQPYGQTPGQGSQGQTGQPPYGPAYGQPPSGQQQSQQRAYRPAPLGGSAQAAYTADGVPLSGWWWRVLAAWLDSIFISILVIIPAFPIYRRMYAAIASYLDQALRAAQAGQTAPPQPAVTTFLSSTDQYVLLAIQVGVALVYNVAFLRWKAATPGKLICGLRVVPVDQGLSREPLAWGTVVVRAMIWVLPMVSLLLRLFQLIDGLFPLWNPKRQALHDIAARTQVIRPQS